MTNRNNTSPGGVVNWKELKAKYPVALGDVYCGISVRDSWVPFLIPVFEVCEREGVEIHQIKEKFGGLRVYTGRVDDAVDAAIEKAEVACHDAC